MDIKQLIPISAEASSAHKNSKLILSCEQVKSNQINPYPDSRNKNVLTIYFLFFLFNEAEKYVLITREEESERVSRQTKPLLYEGANRETVGPKEHRKIICEKVCSWGKQSVYLKDIAQMINLDFSTEMEQWNNFQLLNSDIRIEIGDAILDDIVSEVI